MSLNVTMLTSRFSAFIVRRNPTELTVAEVKLWLQEGKNILREKRVIL